MMCNVGSAGVRDESPVQLLGAMEYHSSIVCLAPHAPQMDGRRPQATPYELAATGHELTFNQFPAGICGALELPSSSSSSKANTPSWLEYSKIFGIRFE